MADPLGTLFCLALIEEGKLDAAKSYDINEEMLQDEARSMLDVILKFARDNKGTLPTKSTVLRKAKVDLEEILGEEPDKLDPADSYANDLRSRHVGNTVAKQIREVNKALRSSPEDGAKALQSASSVIRSASLLRADQIVDITSKARLDGSRARYKEAKSFGGGVRGITTLMPSLDAESLGMQGGEVWVWAAKEKMGKTTLCLANQVHNWITHPDKGCPLIWSGEMPTDQLEARTHAMRAKLHYANFRSGKLGMFGEKKLDAYWEEIEEEKTPFYIVDIQAAKTPEELAALAMDMGASAVFMDGMYIMARRGGADISMWERTVDVIAEAKEWAKITNIPWILTTQFAGTAKGDALTATTNDLGYAKAIAQYADVVMGIFANKDLRKNRRRVIRTLCARDFEGIDLLINFDLDRMNFDELGVIEGDSVGRFKAVTVASGEEDEDDDSKTAAAVPAAAKTREIPF